MSKKRQTLPRQKQVQGDSGLWDRVKKTVDPLDERQRALYSQALADFLDEGVGLSAAHGATQTPAQPIQHRQGAMREHPARAPSPAKTLRPHAAAQPPLVDLDRKTRTRIAKGRTPIDARLDLHGLRQHEAHDVLRGFIWRCHSAGHRTVLVITGKGTRQKDPHPDAPPWAMGSGILKRAVPGWLGAADMRAAVLSVEPAHASHGGEGALYVRLRVNRGTA